MPIDYKKYPSNWKTEIRPAILKRANNKCEFCGVENHAVGARDRFGDWHDERKISGMNSDCGEHYFGYPYPKIIKIVLTVAHLDHDCTNNVEDNLKALCQKCHLTYDAKIHAHNARKTRNKTMELLFHLK